MAGEINDVFDTNSGTTNQTNFKEGTIVTVDADGNEVELYPNVKTDSTLSMVNKPADAAAVGIKLNEIESIAKGANQCLSYESYEAMITALNAMDNTKLKKGQNIYIGTVGVPDLWIYSVEESSSSYTFTDDDTLANAVKENVAVQIGYYKVAQLETQKVDLSEYGKMQFVTELPSDAANHPDVYYCIPE